MKISIGSPSSSMPKNAADPPNPGTGGLEHGGVDAFDVARLPMSTHTSCVPE